MWNLKTCDTNELIYKIEAGSKNKFMVIVGRVGGRDRLKFGTDVYTPLYLK